MTTNSRVPPALERLIDVAVRDAGQSRAVTHTYLLRLTSEAAHTQHGKHDRPRAHRLRQPRPRRRWPRCSP